MRSLVASCESLTLHFACVLLCHCVPDLFARRVLPCSVLLWFWTCFLFVSSLPGQAAFGSSSTAFQDSVVKIMENELGQDCGSRSR